jgi:hypothetical protein
MITLDSSRIGPVAIKTALVIGVFVVGGIADAVAQGRGGGGRGGGGGGHSGGRMASSSVAGSSRGGGNANRGGGNANRGNTANRNTGNRSGNNVGSNNRVNNGNINTGNVNVNRGDVNIDVDGGRYGYGGARYPVAAGMAIGAMAVTTAAVVGSYYYALPSGCTSVVMNGATYSQCGSAYYQKTWQGNDVAYVVVQP